MATTLNSASFEMRLAWDYQNVLDLATTYDKMALLQNNYRTFTNGTGNQQFNTVWHDRRVLTPSTGTDNLDIAGGLTDAFGNTLTFLTIKGIYIENRGILSAGSYVPTAGEDILVGGAGNVNSAFAAWLNGNQDAEVTVRSGGIFSLLCPLAGYAVTAGSTDILRVLLSGSSTNDVYYDIVLFGTR